MRVVIQNDYDNMCKWAANYIIARINNHKEERPIVLGLPHRLVFIRNWFVRTRPVRFLSQMS